MIRHPGARAAAGPWSPAAGGGGEGSSRLALEQPLPGCRWAAELTAARPAACARRNCQLYKPCIAPAVAASAAHKWLLALHCVVYAADGSRQQDCPHIRALYATCCNPGRHGHGGTSHINQRVQWKWRNGTVVSFCGQRPWYVHLTAPSTCLVAQRKSAS